MKIRKILFLWEMHGKEYRQDRFYGGNPLRYRLTGSGMKYESILTFRSLAGGWTPGCLHAEGTFLEYFPCYPLVCAVPGVGIPVVRAIRFR